MKNIFAKFQEYVNKPKRNVFDMSFRNNLTLKFGQLTPVFCKEVIPGDSFKINTAFGLQFMPMKFPVQTPMKAYLHYFYVRNRTIWKDWMDFIGGTKENLVPPYVTPVDKQKFFRVGGLADYLGVPNVVYGNYGLTKDSDLLVSNTVAFLNNNWSSRVRVSESATKYVKFEKVAPINQRNSCSKDFVNQYAFASLSALLGQNYSDVLSDSFPMTDFFTSMSAQSAPANTDRVLASPLIELGNFDLNFEYVPNLDGQVFIYKARLFSHLTYGLWFTGLDDTSYNVLDLNGYNVQLVFTKNGVIHSVMPSTIYDFSITTEDGIPYLNFKFRSVIFSSDENRPDNLSVLFFSPMITDSQSDDDGSYAQILSLLYDSVETSLKMSYELDADRVIGDGSLLNTPYDSQIRLSALPFRAYEAIYNAYYRNPQNNPFVLNGVPEYNRYVTNLEGGADNTQYDLYFRNWEYDFLTSAVQSPQQGIAPLVGMSMTGEATFADEDGNTFYAQAILNDDGEITGWQSHSSNMPVGSLRLLMDMAGTGISINDLRNVNSFQRFLENNIRHGLKYKDQVLSHFGVKIRYDELDMPEFIGGVSTSVDVNKLSQTSNSGDTPLGSFVGQASALGQSKHDITHYCDEHGFIIGIMSVVPVPVYSQLLPKFFVKNSQLDYYFPEFGHIGYQPIQQLEVSPLQTFYAGDDLHAVFGYNRPWYDYLASTDEVHSQFRTTMRDFIMNRTFESAPELSEDFLLVDPDQLNDVFLAGTDDDLYAPEADKIIGSLLFNVSAKRPIPLFGIPKLEA